MTTQIKAAARLSAAKADEAKARKYLESLGIKVGVLDHSYPGRIAFDIDDAAATTKILRQSLKLRPKAEAKGTWIFELGQGRKIIVMTTRPYGTVTLYDKAAR